MRSDIDLSYLSDTILLFRFFEAKAEVRTAISVVKSRTSSHERSYPFATSGDVEQISIFHVRRRAKNLP
jgi:circadian clock protein KaiC